MSEFICDNCGRRLDDIHYIYGKKAHTFCEDCFDGILDSDTIDRCDGCDNYFFESSVEWYSIGGDGITLCKACAELEDLNI